MYITKQQIATIRSAAEEIKRLAAEDLHGLPPDVRAILAPWIAWIGEEADKILSALPMRK